MLSRRIVKKMRCLACGSKIPDDGKRRDSLIAKELKNWHKQEERVIKLLLLGTGESGKSTVTKQMKIIHDDGFTESERRAKIPDIKSNVRNAALILAGAMYNLGIPLTDETNRDSYNYIRSEVAKEDFVESEDYYDHVIRFWADEGVQACYNRSHEYQLFDSAKYFLDSIDSIRSPDYLPSDQDMLRCRVMTNAIKRMDFTAMDSRTEVNFSVFDVGGQTGERRKWIQVFDMAKAIIFVVDCSCFDLTLREENKNRFLDALDNFEHVWNSRFLREVPVLLFLNKIDLLEEKLKNGRTLDNLIDSMDKDHKYYSLLSEFSSFTKFTPSERKEVVEAFPRSVLTKSGTSRASSATSEDIDGSRPRPSRLGRKKSSVCEDIDGSKSQSSRSSLKRSSTSENIEGSKLETSYNSLKTSPICEDVEPNHESSSTILQDNVEESIVHSSQAIDPTRSSTSEITVLSKLETLKTSPNSENGEESKAHSSRSSLKKSVSDDTELSSLEASHTSLKTAQILQDGVDTKLQTSPTIPRSLPLSEVSDSIRNQSSQTSLKKSSTSADFEALKIQTSQSSLKKSQTSADFEGLKASRIGRKKSSIFEDMPRLGRKKSSLAPVYRDDIPEEVIRTAVFIKRVFVRLVYCPVSYAPSADWHKKHSCEYYFTCAVDTQTIKKVLEACRCFIIPIKFGPCPPSPTPSKGRTPTSKRSL